MRRCGLWSGLRVITSAVILAVVLFAVPAAAETWVAGQTESVLPFYSVDGYATTIVYVNPTPHAWPADFAPGLQVGFPGRYGNVMPFSVVRVPWDVAGVGVKRFTHETSLRVYVEITTPVGGVLRAGPLKPVTEATFYDLLTEAPWNSGMFVGSLDGSYARVVGGADAFIPAGGAVILPALSPVVTIENRLSVGFPGASSAPLYAFAYSNHATTYTLLRIE